MDHWSRIPDLLVEKFAEKLDSHRDFLSFGAVCASWRSIFKNNIDRLPSKFPMLHCLPKGKPLPLLLQYSLTDCKISSLFRVTNEKLVKVSHELNLSATRNKQIKGSSRGWLFAVDCFTCETILINPLTGAEVHLPSCLWLQFRCCKTIILSTDPTADTNNLLVMFVSTGRSIYSCRVGDKNWSCIEDLHWMVDLVYFNGLFYAIDLDYNLYEIKITEKENTIDMELVLICKPSWTAIMGQGFLLESSGELLLVLCSSCQNHLPGIPNFEIFRLTCRYVRTNFESYDNNYEWEKVKNIGNQIVLLIQNYYHSKESLSVESALYPEMKGNCIYHFGNVLDGRRIMVVYNLTTHSVEFLLDVAENMDRALWFSPNPW